MLRHAIQNADKEITLDFLINVDNWQCYWKKQGYDNDFHILLSENIFLFAYLLKQYMTQDSPVYNQQIHNKLIATRWTGQTHSVALLASKKYILNNMPKELSEVLNVFEDRRHEWENAVKKHSKQIAKYNKQFEKVKTASVDDKKRQTRSSNSKC